MRLTDEEKRMLDGEYGEVARKSLKILVTLGEIYGAERMLEIKNVHSPGVSYRVAGDAGLNYVKDASLTGCFRTPVTLNTIGIDSEQWEQLEYHFPHSFAVKQLELLKAYQKMGAIPSYTCVPYLTGNIPQKGEHIAWGESSAIAFANSVIGARTNREGGPSALAAAVTGRVPEYGYHLDENRRGKVLFLVDMDLETIKDFSVLGYFAGQIAGNEVPVFEGIRKRPPIDNLKALSAAVASSGAVALYHLVGITPEAPTTEAVIDTHDAIRFGRKEYEDVLEKFSLEGEVDFVVTGCPHCSIMELGRVAQLLSGTRVRAEFWVCTAKQTKVLGDRMGYTQIIERAGARVICDTCPVLAPTSSRGYKTLITNSGKLAHYAPGLWQLNTGLVEIEECVDAAIKGKRGLA